MLCDFGCVICVISPTSFESFCLFVCYLLWMFLHCFWSIFICFYIKNPKTHKKIENSKSLIGIIVYCHKHVLPCTFVLMALCIYEHCLFFMHSYHCGGNLDIYVIVVNRSLNLLWMISQWSDLENCIDLCLYIFPFFYFYFFGLKSSTNVNLKMKRDNELQKPLHILVFCKVEFNQPFCWLYSMLICL